MSKLAAIYARVSSERQKEDKTIGSQTQGLKEFALAHDYVVPENLVFEDEGFSGATLARPGLERLRDVVSEGQIEVVLVHSPDRLSRKYAYQVVLIEEFSRKGVETVFIKGPAGQSPEDQLLVQFQGMIAEYERAQLMERYRRGKRYRAKAGVVNVLSGAPYGYRYMRKTVDSDGCYVVNEDEAVGVRQVYQWYTHDWQSIGAIARSLNNQAVPTRKGGSRWERSTVWAVLRNPAYIGRAAYGKTESAERKRVRPTRPLRQKGGYSARCSASHERPRDQWIEIPVPALIDEPTFARAQERLAENKRLSAKNTRHPTLLQGLLVCGKCGYGMYRTATKTTCRQAQYYRCLGSDGYRHLIAPKCDARPIRFEDLDQIIWSQVENLLGNPALIRAELERRREEGLRSNPLEQRRKKLQHDIGRVGNQIDKILDAYQEGLLSLNELRQRMPVLRKKQTTMQKEAENAHWQAMADEQLRQLDQSLESFLGRMKQVAQNLGALEKQKIVRLLIKEIVVENDTITVRHCIPLRGDSGGDGRAGMPAVPGPFTPNTPVDHPNAPSHEPNYQVCTGSDLAPVEQSVLALRPRPVDGQASPRRAV
jgi:site-specific DNA recombinase